MICSIRTRPMSTWVRCWIKILVMMMCRVVRILALGWYMYTSNILRRYSLDVMTLSNLVVYWATWLNEWYY